MTIDQTNISVYKSLYQHKALTEKIIGTTDYSFQYAVASYKAVCTEGVDFTMFDKVICGILQIDEVSGFEEIANILGLNVVHRPEEGKYIDFGEKEILEYAIKSLIEFNMVETDDIYYSRCRLTEIGKDYAKQGKKFLPATPKEFKIYYDLTDQKHQEAKKRFGKLTGVRQSGSLDFEVSDEAFVKEVAKVQTPEIYNPNLLRNFTSLDLRAIDVFAITFKVVGLVSIKDNSVRFLAFDDKHNLNQSISDIIEGNIAIRNELLEKLLTQHEPVKAKSKSDFQKQHETEITGHQQEVENLLSQKQGEKAFIKIKEVYSKSSIIEEPYFDLNFKEFFDENSKEFWIIISQLNQHLFNEIKEIIERKAKIENNVFIIAQSDISQEASQYFNNTAATKPNIFWGAADEIVETIILLKNGKNKKVIANQPVLLNLPSTTIEQNAYFQINEWNNDISELYKHYKQSLAGQYCLLVYDEVQESFKKLLQNIEHITKKKIEEFELYIKKLNIFRSQKEHTQWINDFYESAKENIDEKLKLPLKQKIDLEITKINDRIQDEEMNYTISELREFEDKLQELKSNLYDENTEGGIKIKNLEDLIKPKIQALSKLEKKITPKPQIQKSNSIKSKR